jgi:hypothetical protein
MVVIIASDLIAPSDARAEEVINYPNFQVTQAVRSTTGARTAGPFVAASMMGAEGYSNVLPPPPGAELEAAITSITSSCTAMTNLLPQQERNMDPNRNPVGTGSLWPEGCNPAGMARALNAIPNPASLPPNTPPPSWVVRTWDGAHKQDALNAVFNSILTFHSPGIIPIYGVADHWFAIVDVRTTNGIVTHAKWIDSGPNDGETPDGLGNTYLGAGIATPQVISDQYYQVLTSINSACDGTGGCTQDPYYNKFVLMFEPPQSDQRPLPPVAFAKPRGVAQVMNETLAQRYVWEAIASAGVDSEPEVKNVITAGVAGTAFLVNAVYPDGSPWDYYLVPILSKTDGSAAIAFVQLAAADGSFENINFLTRATSFSTITMEKARKLADGMLTAGEHLTTGRLTWDPLASTTIRRSPVQPYYEFEAIGSAGTLATVVRVSFTDGTMERSP